MQKLLAHEDPFFVISSVPLHWVYEKENLWPILP
jgi:hypothetical protein